MSKFISCAETSKLIRKALKASSPAIKFSVRSSVYSGGASVDVSWTDGPTHDQVNAIAGQFSGASFDGMIDLKSYHSSTFEGEEVNFGADYVFCTRHESPPFLEGVKSAWAAMSEDERWALMHKTRAYLAANHVSSWRLDAELSDFGNCAGDVFQCMASQIPQEA